MYYLPAKYLAERDKCHKFAQQQNKQQNKKQQNNKTNRIMKKRLFVGLMILLLSVCNNTAFAQSRAERKAIDQAVDEIILVLKSGEKVRGYEQIAKKHSIRVSPEVDGKAVSYDFADIEEVIYPANIARERDIIYHIFPLSKPSYMYLLLYRGKNISCYRNNSSVYTPSGNLRHLDFTYFAEGMEEPKIFYSTHSIGAKMFMKHQLKKFPEAEQLINEIFKTKAFKKNPEILIEALDKAIEKSKMSEPTGKEQ